MSSNGGARSTGRQRFAGKSVIVTGAASGIGRETAVAFAAEGARVVVADVAEAGAQATTAALVQSGGQARACVVDVSDASSVQAMVDDAVHAHGGVDVLHNNAYWAPLNRPVVDTTDEEWQRTIGVTLTSVFLGCRSAIPYMVEAGGGAIVNTASVAGALTGSPRFAAYMAAKGGVVALTRSVAFDYGAQGIRCNAVCPGLVETPATASLLVDEERRAWLTSKLLVGRLGQPRDVADAVLYLAGEESSYITGQTLVIDGGRLIS